MANKKWVNLSATHSSSLTYFTPLPASLETPRSLTIAWSGSIFPKICSLLQTESSSWPPFPVSHFFKAWFVTSENFKTPNPTGMDSIFKEDQKDHCDRVEGPLILRMAGYFNPKV